MCRLRQIICYICRVKKLLILLAAVLLASAPVSAKSVPDSLRLESRYRLDTTLRIVLPVHFGLTTLMDADYKGSWEGTGYGDFLDTRLHQNFMFNIEMFGVRWCSRGIPFEANLGVRWSFMNFSSSKIHASYIGAPLRFVFRFGRQCRVYAGASAEYLVHGHTNTLFSPFRATVEGGVAYAGVGLFASYGLTPLFLPSCSDAKTFSFGIVVGI